MLCPEQGSTKFKNPGEKLNCRPAVTQAYYYCTTVLLEYLLAVHKRGFPSNNPCLLSLWYLQLPANCFSMKAASYLDTSAEHACN